MVKLLMSTLNVRVHAVDRGDLETTVVTVKFLVSTFYMISNNFLTFIFKVTVFTIKNGRIIHSFS